MSHPDLFEMEAKSTGYFNVFSLIRNAEGFYTLSTKFTIKSVNKLKIFSGYVFQSENEKFYVFVKPAS